MCIQAKTKNRQMIILMGKRFTGNCAVILLYFLKNPYQKHTYNLLQSYEILPN